MLESWKIPKFQLEYWIPVILEYMESSKLPYLFPEEILEYWNPAKFENFNRSRGQLECWNPGKANIRILEYLKIPEKIFEY